jgi:TPP-dependent 2-oxoacid decarboxylase
MRVETLFAQINAFLEEDDVVIADPGDALFGAADLHIEHGVRFLGPAYYCSLGFAVPAVLGVSSALPGLRVETEHEMAAALTRARANKGAYTLIQVMLPKDDHSPALRRLTAHLAERIHKGAG